MTTLHENEEFWEGRGGLNMKKDILEGMGIPKDNVNHPSHYCAGGVECIDGIRAVLGQGFVDYCQGNAIKYLWRWRHKGGVEDLRKAQVYLGWMIKTVEGEKK